MKRLLREPLFHFLVLGALLFALFELTQAGKAGSAQSTQIRLTLEELSQLALLFQAQWRREPTAEELSRLVESKVQEEILYREALAMGLDKNDTIVKRRLAQKMRFLAEDAGAARDPTAAELKSYFEQNRALFAQSTRLSFRHLYFSPDRRGGRAREDAAGALAQLAGERQDAKIAASLADPFMFQDYYRERAPEHLRKEFGPQFALAVERIAPGAWQGPVPSGFGWHLVYVDTSVPGRAPPFEEVEADVKTAWLSEQKARAWEKAYKEMRARYTLLLPPPPVAQSSAVPLPGKGSATAASAP